MAGKRSKVFETKFFGLIIGVLIFFIFLTVDKNTEIFSNLEQKMLDVHFRFKNIYVKKNIEEGVSQMQRNPNISEDILILGIDFNSLTKFGKWPFPRYREANLLDSFSRIQNQNERERAVFLDLFFVEPDEKGYDDVLLLKSMYENGRVFLETVADENPNPADNYDEFFNRQEVLFKTCGRITDIQGDWEKIEAYYGLQPPLKPYGNAVKGYGHANYREDIDDVYRRQPLIIRTSRLIDTFPFEKLTIDYPVNRKEYERLEWVDINGLSHPIPYPLSRDSLKTLKKQLELKAPVKSIDLDGDGEADESYFLIRKYKDSFIPAITLSLTLNYVNRTFSDMDIILGEEIIIHSPQEFNVEKNEWEAFKILTADPVYDVNGTIVKEAEYQFPTEIRIPIDEQGKMLINYMGPSSSADPKGYKTFPVRSFSGYASNPPSIDPQTWPRTKAVGNKILMVGAFARGIAEDEKPTPYGMMYGVEIHANALNTILMNKFIYDASELTNIVILFGFVIITAFVTSRFKTIWSFIISFLFIIGYFLGTTMIFDMKALVLNFTQPAFGVAFSFLSVVIYRVMTEERDKKRIRVMFGKYVSPGVVDHLLDNPPELGGVDKHLTVFFSDVRGFTTLSESMTPQELLNHLNVYFTKMTDIILSYNGTLDKYVGDEIMCFWGAPLPQEDHALFACRCALEQSKALNELNENWPVEKRINIGIGINSGIMTVGNVGSEGRMNYTLMGDPVNLGARLEGTNKQYGTQIIISENTYGLVKDHVIVRELDNIRVKGKNKPVVIYELVDCD